MEGAAGTNGASAYAIFVISSRPSGGSGGSDDNAFFIDRQNLRFDLLCKLFQSLGIEHCGNFINKHPAVKGFIKGERADSSNAEKELRDFIEYRNEAAHRKVENVLSIDAIDAIGRFLIALGDALADMVDEGMLKRRMELNHYALLLSVKEIYHDGYVVIGTPDIGTRLAVGDEVVVCGKRSCYRATLVSMQIEDRPVPDTTGDGATEVGLRLSKRITTPAELRRLEIPTEAPREIQLQIEDVVPTMKDAAETDLPEATESESVEEVIESDEVASPDGTPPTTA